MRVFLFRASERVETPDDNLKKYVGKSRESIQTKIICFFICRGLFGIIYW